MTPRYEFGGLPENSLVKLGAERERRRIRRAQTTAIKLALVTVRFLHDETVARPSELPRVAVVANSLDLLHQRLGALDAATRAPRKKGRK